MTDDELFEAAEEHYDGYRDVIAEYCKTIEDLRADGLSDEHWAVLASTSIYLEDLLSGSLIGFMAHSRLTQAQQIAVRSGTSREKTQAILEAIGAPSRSKTINRQLLEWWDELSRMDTEHPGVLLDPLELAPKTSELVFPPNEGSLYSVQSIRLGVDGKPIEHFAALRKLFSLTDEGFLQRLRRAASEALVEGDSLGNTWIPTLDTVLMANPPPENSFPPEILALARARRMSKVDQS